MFETEETIADGEPTIRPGVLVDGTALSAKLDAQLLRVVVDNDIRLPGMFELTFLDVDGTVLTDAGISIGAKVTVSGVDSAGTATTIIVGEVTAIEGLIQGITLRTVVRGYTEAHRLQRLRRSRSFLNVTDSDVARTIATDAGLTIGDIDTTSTTHAYLAQVNQTDWEFLTSRAQEIGFQFGVADSKFFFRSTTGVSGGLSGALSGLASATGTTGMTGKTASVRFPENMISFRPRVTAGNLAPKVEARVWDPMARKAAAQTTGTPTGAAPSASSLGNQFAPGGIMGSGASMASAASTIASAATSAATSAESALSRGTGGLLGSPVGDLGPQPSTAAHIVVDKPFADQASMATAGPVVAGALGSDHGSTFAEAEGEVKGNASIQPGTTVDITGVQSMFTGNWMVSRARHIFDDSEFGYRVIFSAHGHQDRTMLGLTSKATRRGEDRGVLDGVVCGVVTNCADPLAKGRVKVTLPWLSPDFETDWAPVIQFMSGQKTGAIFLPEVGDETLVAFEFGDVRRPYVLGGMMNNLTQWDVAAAGPMQAGGEFASAILDGVMAAADSGTIIDKIFDFPTDMMGKLGRVEGMVANNLAASPGFWTGGMVDTSAAGDAFNGMLDQSQANLETTMGTLRQGYDAYASGVSGGLVDTSSKHGSSGGTGASGGTGGTGGTGASAAGSVVTPGMVSEVHHRGYVSSTHNSLVFYDVPMPLGGMTGAGGVSGMGGAGGSGGSLVDIGGITDVQQSTSVDFGGGSGGTGGTGGKSGTGTGASGTGMGMGVPALGSAARLGSQNGEVAVTIDQVNAGVSINAAMVPGTSIVPLPSVSITAENGLVYLGTGETGAMLINGGAGLVISATGTITLAAETVNVAGILTVNGTPVPLV